MAKSNSAKKSNAEVPADGMAALMGMAVVEDKKVGKKDEKKTIQVFDKTVAEKIDQYSKAKADLEAAKERMADAESEIKPYGEKLFLDEIEKTGLVPESFILASKESGLLYIVQDGYKYAGLTPERIEYLRGLYGSEVVTTTTEFVLNKDQVQQYGAAIVKAIMASTEIPAAVKPTLIKAIPTHRIQKGAIKKLKEFAAKAKCKISQVFTDIEPIQQLKERGEK
jgi:hypothetical protein